jgi:hypothetical protein
MGYETSLVWYSSVREVLPALPVCGVRVGWPANTRKTNLYQVEATYASDSSHPLLPRPATRHSVLLGQ